MATNDVRMHTRERKSLADALTCIRQRTTLRQAGRALAAKGERYLLSEALFRERDRDWPEAIRLAEQVAWVCSFSLSDLRRRAPLEGAVPGVLSEEALEAGEEGW